MSFCLSFHQASRGPTGAHWLDDPPEVCPLIQEGSNVTPRRVSQLPARPLAAASHASAGPVPTS
jgi:hypothetical protein